MKMEFTLLPFHFPNFIRVKELADKDGMIDVATFSDREAEEYWKNMQAEWMAHIQRRRKADNG